MKGRCFLLFFCRFLLLNVWSVLHISTACDYFSLSWMSPLSVNVVFFRWTSAMHFYKQLKLVLFEFLSVLFLFFLNLVIGWMYLFFSILRNVPFGVVLHLFVFSHSRCISVSQNSILSFKFSDHKALPWRREVRIPRMWRIFLPSCRTVDKVARTAVTHLLAPSTSPISFARRRRNRACRRDSRHVRYVYYRHLNCIMPNCDKNRITWG